MLKTRNFSVESLSPLTSAAMFTCPVSSDGLRALRGTSARQMVYAGDAFGASTTGIASKASTETVVCTSVDVPAGTIPPWNNSCSTKTAEGEAST